MIFEDRREIESYNIMLSVDELATDRKYQGKSLNVRVNVDEIPPISSVSLWHITMYERVHWCLRSS